MSDNVPDETIERAVRLTRWARRETAPEADQHRARRDELLAAHGYVARVREDGTGRLVIYPDAWVEEGTIRRDRIDDIDRAIERPLVARPDDWEAVWAHNRELAELVESDHGSVHGENALALAEFASNHYATRIEQLPIEALEEFLTEYFPRNAWPSADQRAVVEKSVQLTFATAGEPSPL